MGKIVAQPVSMQTLMIYTKAIFIYLILGSESCMRTLNLAEHVLPFLAHGSQFARALVSPLIIK